MRIGLALGLIALAAPAAAQQMSAADRTDTALVRRILVAEDRRDSLDASLTEGARHQDARVQWLARRALWRIRDPLFAARDSLPPATAPMAWPEPAWRLRYRALTAARENCGALKPALDDASWPVRLRAMDLAGVACAGDSSVASLAQRWVDALPRNTGRREAGGISWHAGAHGIVALARLRPTDVRRRLERLARHPQWQVRMYTARAAAVVADTALLRFLASDRDDNVKEAAIEALSRLSGHGDDQVYVRALAAKSAQAVRAAALALKGTPRADARAEASSTFERWVKRANASERDARVALLEAAGRPVTDDRPPVQRTELPRRAVSMALGEDVRLRVTMASSSGGRSFVVRLRGDNAPIMAARVLALATASPGYYKNGIWHRVEHDFVIQGAGPGTNEYVGLNEYLRDELGNVPHVRGTIGMSTRGHDTGDAQWFINLRDNPRLIRDYTVFAEVVEGMDVVDGIMEGDMVASITELRPSRRR